MGKQWKECQTLYLGGSKITADGGCSHEIKRYLLLGRKVMTNLDSVFKSRDITLPTKVHLVKAMLFPLTRWTFVGKVMFLLLNTLSRLVITFLPRSKRLLISWLKSLQMVTAATKLKDTYSLGEKL